MKLILKNISILRLTCKINVQPGEFSRTVCLFPTTMSCAMVEWEPCTTCTTHIAAVGYINTKFTTLTHNHPQSNGQCPLDVNWKQCNLHITKQNMPSGSIWSSSRLEILLCVQVIRTGSISYIPSGKPHRYIADTQSHCWMLWLYYAHFK